MLADPRAEMLSTNFASQWLHLQNLKNIQPDAYQFPNYSKNLSQSMLRETELFFANTMVKHDESVLDLLTADYTFVDELLARHYGFPNVAGEYFRRVQIPDANRRGLLGQASVLTLTSVSTRTSPVGRGKYVMEVLLGTPPPAPPPDVPSLKESAGSGDAPSASLRQQMEQHRRQEPCASCHKMMDPIGFALENFDAVGAWRARDGNVRIDAAGKLFDGTELNGPASLRQAIVGHSDAFLAGFAENLLGYGVGRVHPGLSRYARGAPVLRARRKAIIDFRHLFWVWSRACHFKWALWMVPRRLPWEVMKDVPDQKTFIAPNIVTRHGRIVAAAAARLYDFPRRRICAIRQPSVRALWPVSKSSTARRAAPLEGTQKLLVARRRLVPSFSSRESLQPLEHLREYLSIVSRTDFEARECEFTPPEVGGEVISARAPRI